LEDIKMEATAGFEPANKGFAGLCLTTWPRRLKSHEHEDKKKENGAGEGI
jgi:hypothetical protein